MKKNAHREEDHQSSALNHSIVQKKQAPTTKFVDNRSKTVTQQQLQQTANNSPQVKKTAQLQAAADQYTQQQMPANNEAPIQRKIDVHLKTNKATKKSLVAEGSVKDFKGGSSAGSRGWLGVEKYRSWYTVVDDEENEESDEVGPLYNDFTNPEAGHVLAKRNGGDGGDPENIFAQDGGTNNGTYKSFENNMNTDLGQYDDDDDVTFKSYLVGTNIVEGNISDAGLDDASDISSDESSDEEEDEEDEMSA